MRDVNSEVRVVPSDPPFIEVDPTGGPYSVDEALRLLDRLAGAIVESVTMPKRA